VENECTVNTLFTTVTAVHLTTVWDEIPVAGARNQVQSTFSYLG